MIAMQMKTAFIALSLALLLLVSCAPKSKAMPPAMPKAPVSGAADQAVSDIESSVSEVDSLDKELDTSNLDAMDSNLAELDAMDLS